MSRFSSPVSLFSLFASLPLLAAAACSSSDPAPSDIPDAATCSAAWTTITFNGNQAPPQSLEWSGGTLFFATSPPLAEIDAISDSGHGSRVVAPRFAEQMWADGDQLLFAAGDHLSAVPLSGGDAALVANGPAPDDESYRVGHAIDGSSFYWTQQESGTRTLWRMPRTGGAAESLADLGEVIFAPAITVIGDDVVAAVSEGRAWAVAKTGGALRALHAASGAGNLLGFDDVGPLWDVNTSHGLTVSHATVGVNAKSGAPSTFWGSMPATFAPSRVVRDGEGYVVLGSEAFSDRASRASAWRIDGAGAHGARLGCAPAGTVIVNAVTLSPSAVFASVEDATGSGSVVKIAR